MCWQPSCGRASTLKLNVFVSNRTLQLDQLSDASRPGRRRLVSISQQVKLTLATSYSLNGTNAANTSNGGAGADDALTSDKGDDVMSDGDGVIVTR